jgi:DNA-binding winged helix-turn-helix (wHTH) protein/predicted ATPase
MVYRFGACLLDTQQHRLQRAGQSMWLRSKVVQVLLYLLEHRDRTVLKQELCEQVWPQQFISDATLESTVRAARRAIGDTGRAQQIIRTVYGYGYRFIAAVEVGSDRHPDGAAATMPSLPGSASTPSPDVASTTPLVPRTPVSRGDDDGHPAIGMRDDEGLTPHTADPLLRTDPQSASARAPSPPVTQPATPPSETDGAERTRADAVGLSPVWEQKSVAVLAIECTFPTAPQGQAATDEPWTAASRWEEVLVTTVQGYGGVLLQRSPSLLLVAFGLPQTLEQVPQRAVQAALTLQTLISAESEGDTCPALRQAIHGGQLLVEVSAHGSAARLLPRGEVLALPVRLLGHAVVGEILVTSAVGRLVEGWCACQPHAGPPGIETLLVTGLTPRPSPLRWHGRRPRSRFVGRERELTTLTDLLAQATEGRGQVVGIVGEPGIGKSRLLYEFQQHLRAPSVPYVEGQCLSYGQALPFAPVLALLRQHCGITEADAPEVVTAKVRLSLQTAGIDPEEGAPYLCQLLGLPVGRERLADLSPERRKTRTFETLQQLYLACSQQHPLVLAVENLHWIDPTSEAFLASLIESLAGARLCVLFTYRPGYRPPWIDKSYATQMVLPPLSAADSRRMLGSVLPTDTITATLAQQILTKAQGNPFFLEEIAQTLVDQGGPRRESGMTLPPALQLPATVQEVLGARIDRLPADEKALLQTLAVIGQVCSRRLLMRIVAHPEAEVSPRLSNLQAAELLYEQPAVPEPMVTFKHILTQEVAYHSLSQARQCALHERTAQAIEGLVGDRLAEHYSELAYHYSCSDNTRKAVVYLQRAGQQAADRSAYGEAITHLTRGLELLPNLPDTLERSQHELDLQLTLGYAFSPIKGQASPEVEHAFTRAHALCEQVGETAQLFAVLRGLKMMYVARGPLSKARELAEQILGLAQCGQDAVRLASAHMDLETTSFFLGAFASARAHLEQGRVIADSVQDASDALRRGHYLSVQCRRYEAWTLWYLGSPDQALQLSHEALGLAQERGYLYIVAWALFYAGILHCLRREAPAAQERAEATMALARQHEFRGLLARGTRLRGWALAAQGQHAEGFAQMHQGLTAYQAAGEAGLQPLFRALLAEMYARVGRATAGLSALDGALAYIHKNGSRWYEAELHRLTGELLLRQEAGRGVAGSPPPELPMINGSEGEGTGHTPPPTEAETWFRQALDIARQQQAKSLELRAATSLSRLWQGQGRRTEAHQLLASVYGWFTEGFDTADLQDAKALLETLS